MYPDPILAGRLAIAMLQELYTEADQSRRRTDPSQRHQKLVRASTGRLGALRMSLGTWLEGLAQTDRQAVAGMATGQAQLIAHLLQAIKAWSLQRTGQKREAAASCPRPGCPVNGASIPEVELHRGRGIPQTLNEAAGAACIVTLEPDGKLSCLRYGQPAM